MISAWKVISTAASWGLPEPAAHSLRQPVEPPTVRPAGDPR